LANDHGVRLAPVEVLGRMIQIAFSVRPSFSRRAKEVDRLNLRETSEDLGQAL
jgi:hypothetical protein